MFKRRKSRTIFQNTREFIWPAMGWVRAFQYVKHRLIRLSDSTYRIAAGLASGACISFTPLVGLHFFQALLLAYLVKGNYLASIIGTFWGNPWTFPPMWLLGYNVGITIFSLFGITGFAELPENFTLSTLWDILWDDPLRLFVPWVVGGYICALVSWPIFFAVFYHLIYKTKAARRRMKIRKVHKVARQVTGQKK